MKTRHFATICITVIVLVILCAMTLLGITVAAVYRTIDDTVMNKSFNEFSIGDNFPKLKSMTYDVENLSTKYSVDTHIYTTDTPYRRQIQTYVTDFSPQFTWPDNPELNPNSLAVIDVGTISVQTVFDITIEVTEVLVNTQSFVFTKDNVKYPLTLTSNDSKWRHRTYLYIGKDLEYMVLAAFDKHYAISTKDFSVTCLNIFSYSFDNYLHGRGDIAFHYYSDGLLYSFIFGPRYYPSSSSILVTPLDYSITAQPYPPAKRPEYTLPVPMYDGYITNLTIAEEV